MLSGTVKAEERRHGGGRFCLIFFSCLVVFLLGYLKLRTSAVFLPVLAANAAVTSPILNLLGASATAHGAMVSSPDFAFKVIPECTSIVFSGIFACAVLAWPCQLRDKLIGIAFGAVTLFLLNLVRLITLFYIGTHFPRFLNAAHFFGWQALMVLLTLGLWLFWMEKLTTRRRR